MIFVTVGAQMPFDRLVLAVDRWAAEAGRDDVFAQIGESEQPPQHIKFTKFLSTSEFRQRIGQADVVVAHAGTGCILDTLSLGKPILVMPRHAALMETRNDHQIATAQEFRSFPGVWVAMDEAELHAKLGELSSLTATSQVRAPQASSEIIERIRSFIRAAPAR